MKVTINKETGLGEERNIYTNFHPVQHPGFPFDRSRKKFYDFKEAHPQLPVLSPTGEQLTSGTWEVEKVWQYKDYGDESKWATAKDCLIEDRRYTNTMKREAYRVITKPKVKEEKIYGPGDDNYGRDQSVLKVKETVEEMAAKTFPIIMDTIFHAKPTDINKSRRFGFIVGAQWQQSNYKDKVIAIIENKLNDCLNRTDIIEAIKELK